MKADDLRGLTSATVMSADAQPVGELAAVHVNEASDLLFVEIEGRSGRNLVIPADQVRLHDELIVPFGAVRVRQGPALPEGSDLSPDLARTVLTYYGSAVPVVEPEEIPALPGAPETSTPSEAPGEGGDDPFKRENWPPLVKFVGPAVAQLVSRPFGGASRQGSSTSVAPLEEDEG